MGPDWPVVDPVEVLMVAGRIALAMLCLIALVGMAVDLALYRPEKD